MEAKTMGQSGSLLYSCWAIISRRLREILETTGISENATRNDLVAYLRLLEAAGWTKITISGKPFRNFLMLEMAK